MVIRSRSRPMEEAPSEAPAEEAGPVHPPAGRLPSHARLVRVRVRVRVRDRVRVRLRLRGRVRGRGRVRVRVRVRVRGCRAMHALRAQGKGRRGATCLGVRVSGQWPVVSGQWSGLGLGLGVGVGVSGQGQG